MNIPINLPDSLDLAQTKVRGNGQVVTLIDVMEGSADWFSQPWAVLEAVSDLLINGKHEIGEGLGSFEIELVSWGLCPTP